MPSVSDQQHTHRASKSSPDMREPIPSEGRCCSREICCLHMSILQGACKQQYKDRESQPSGCLWVRIFRPGRRCRKEKFCLPVPILQWTSEQQREDRANQPSICVQQKNYVQDGEVSKQTRHHAHSCPVCSTVVRSSLSCGRIKVQHDMPSGKPCHNKQWHVPKKDAQRKTKRKNRRALHCRPPRLHAGAGGCMLRS